MFRDLSLQLNFAATVSVLTLALFAVSSSIGHLSGSGSDVGSIVTLTAPVQR